MLNKLACALVASVCCTALAAAAEPIHVVFLLHEEEYKSAETIPAFADAELAARYGWQCTYIIGEREHALPRIDAVAHADLLFISMRRQILPAAQLLAIRKHVEAGKPVVGLRTASHAFSLRRGTVPEGHASWPEFDAKVLGGNYTGHADKNAEEPTLVWVHDGAREHPILHGVCTDKFQTASWLYLVSPLASTATPLMFGAAPGEDVHPVAWTNTSVYGGPVFYTSLGHPDDFANPNFRRLLVNGVVWALAEAGTPNLNVVYPASD